MNIEEELLAKAIHYLNQNLQHNKVTGVDLNIDGYDDGSKRISVTVDYIPKKEG